MMQRPVVPRTHSRTHSPARRGSTLILVLVMTLSLAGLAVSAILLTSSSSLVQRYYDKEKEYRLYAQAAIARVKSTVQRDTTVTIPSDTAYRALTAVTIADAAGDTNTTIRVNAYAAYTGGTGGTYIPFLTLMAQAYDTLGVRSVQRLDLQSESFSRFGMFVDSFPKTVELEVGQHIHGPVYGNRDWSSSNTSPGPDYYDTVSVVGTVSGKANYHGIAAVESAKRIKWPTTGTPDITLLSTLASAGNLSFTPASGTSGAICAPKPAAGAPGPIDLSGQLAATIATCTANVGYAGSGAAINATRGSRLRFRPVDVNNNGTYDASEGFFEIFDLAAGMDTASLRADLPKTTGSFSNIVTMNQCGLMTTIAGMKEFFPVSRFRELWVQTRVQLSTAPVVTLADATTMGGKADQLPTDAAVNKILSYGNGYSRCFPAGSPYLMLAERYVNAACAIDSSTASTPWGWGAAGATCGAAVQYGGRDTTFTVNARRCSIKDSGVCSAAQFRLGNWKAFGGTNSASPPASVIVAREVPYLWPISSAYNSVSQGVISATAGPLYVSDTLRGYATLYVNGALVLTDDVVYDKDPVDPAAYCRNMLGLISAQSMSIANNALNFPRPDVGPVAFRFLGTPNFTLHATTMALSGSSTVEDSTVALVMSPAITCNGANTSGGCLNQTGGMITKIWQPTHTNAGTGLIRNLMQDPCQDRDANRRPPFFPLTGRYVDYKAYEAYSRTTSTWPMIKTYYSRLRGSNRAVP